MSCQKLCTYKWWTCRLGRWWSWGVMRLTRYMSLQSPATLSKGVQPASSTLCLALHTTRVDTIWRVVLVSHTLFCPYIYATLISKQLVWSPSYTFIVPLWGSICTFRWLRTETQKMSTLTEWSRPWAASNELSVSKASVSGGEHLERAARGWAGQVAWWTAVVALGEEAVELLCKGAGVWSVFSAGLVAWLITSHATFKLLVLSLFSFWPSWPSGLVWNFILNVVQNNDLFAWCE